MTADDELRDTRDHVWEVLGSTPIRRAMLGRERADAIVRVALSECQASNAAGPENPSVVELRVRARYRESNGFAFMSLLVAWAISAIVQAVVIRWWNEHREGGAA